MTSTSDPRQPPASSSSDIPAVSSSTTANPPTTTAQDAASGQQPAAAAASTAELASAKINLLASLRSFEDFPIPGITFIDIMPLFQNPATHHALLRALELQILDGFGSAAKPDVIVGLDARGFLFGPSLALRFNASFVPVRKQGKLPGPCVTATYEKEYGSDYFQMQEGSIKPGQRVLVVDDIIATGGSAAAAGSLVKQQGGELMGYLFVLEIAFLKGKEKLNGTPTVTLLESES